MDRNHFLVAAAMVGTGVVAGTSIALAQSANPPFQGMSNENLRESRAHVLELIEELKLDNADYHGYRVQALDQLNGAKDQLMQALQFRNPSDRGDAASDTSIRRAATACERISANLTADASDYGGHRLKAIDNVKQAHQLLQKALNVT